MAGHSSEFIYLFISSFILFSYYFFFTNLELCFDWDNLQMVSLVCPSWSHHWENPFWVSIAAWNRENTRTPLLQIRWRDLTFTEQLDIMFLQSSFQPSVLYINVFVFIYILRIRIFLDRPKKQDKLTSFLRWIRTEDTMLKNRTVLPKSGRLATLFVGLQYNSICH